MIQLGMYASFLGTLAFWAVFCAIPIAYRISMFLCFVGIVGLSVSLNGKARIEFDTLIAATTYLLIVCLGFFLAGTKFRKVLASCHSPTRGMVRTISIRFLLGWMCVVSFGCVLVNWLPISTLSWVDILFVIAAIAVAASFYIAMNLILGRTILQATSSQSPQRLLLYVVLWFAISQACVPMFGYCFDIPYADLDLEIPVLFLSCLFFQTLLFLFLRMAGERLISIDSPAEKT